MAGIAQGFSLLDAQGNPLSSLLVPTPGGQSNPLLTQAQQGAGTSTLISNSTSLAAAASGTISLPAAAGKITYCRGFCVSSAPAAAVVTGQVFLSGPTNTLLYEYAELVANQSILSQYFGETGIPGSAINTAIVLNFPAITGGAVTTLTIWGYQL
jgi:hypothetical protein